MPKNLKLKAARAEKDMTQGALAEAAAWLLADVGRFAGRNGDSAADGQCR